MSDTENGGPLSGGAWNNSVSGFDASAYGGKDSGFDPKYNPETGQYRGGGGISNVGDTPIRPLPEAMAWPGSQYTDTQLKDMFKNEPGWRTPQDMQGLAPAGNLDNGLTQANWGYRNDGTARQSDPNAGYISWAEPGSLAYKLGIRNPGSEASQNFFNNETTPERDTRMGLVGDAIGGVGKALVSAMTPAPISIGLNMYNAYQNYQNDPNKDMGKAFANALTGAGGYVGALSNMYNGNYGAAAASVLGKNGVDPTTANAIGIGTDYATGKNIGPALGGLVGQIGGSRIGGTLGGLFGSSLGKSIGQNNSVRK